MLTISELQQLNQLLEAYSKEYKKRNYNFLAKRIDIVQKMTESDLVTPTIIELNKYRKQK